MSSCSEKNTLQKIAKFSLETQALKASLGLRTSDSFPLETTINTYIPTVKDGPIAVSLESREYSGSAFLSTEVGASMSQVISPFCKVGLGYKTSPQFPFACEVKVFGNSQDPHFTPQIHVSVGLEL